MMEIYFHQVMHLDKILRDIQHKYISVVYVDKSCLDTQQKLIIVKGTSARKIEKS